MIDLDVLVVGGGPAGLSAAGQLVRSGLRTMVFERARPGGLLWNAGRVENYPGFPGGISGPELASLFRNQALGLGVTIEALSIRRLRPSGHGFFTAEAGRTGIRAGAAIVASGTRPIRARLPGCAVLMGRRAFTEIADVRPEEMKGRRALIIGGGDAAFDYALQWRDRGGEPEILIRSKPKSLELLADRARDAGIRVMDEVKIIGLTKKSSGILLSYRKEKMIFHREADVLLLACGREPDLSGLAPFLRPTFRKKAAGILPPGLFGAGDVIQGRYRQTGIAVGDGLRAAMAAVDYLKGTEVHGNY
jgi:thioredoxin reductase (NADPH)